MYIPYVIFVKMQALFVLLLLSAPFTLAQVFSSTNLLKAAAAETLSQRCSTECFFGPNMDTCVDLLANMLTFNSPITGENSRNIHYVADLVEFCFSGNSSSANGWYTSVALKAYASSNSLYGQWASSQCTWGWGYSPQVAYTALSNVGGNWSPNLPSFVAFGDRCDCSPPDAGHSTGCCGSPATGWPYQKMVTSANARGNIPYAASNEWPTWPTSPTLNPKPNEFVPYTNTWSSVDNVNEVSASRKPINVFQLSRTSNIPFSPGSPGSPLPLITVYGVTPSSVTGASSRTLQPPSTSSGWTPGDSSTLQASSFSFYPTNVAGPPVLMWTDTDFTAGSSGGPNVQVESINPNIRCRAGQGHSTEQIEALRNACMGNCVPTNYWSQMVPNTNTPTAPFLSPSTTSIWCDAPSSPKRPNSASQGVWGYGLCPTDENGLTCSGKGDCLSNALCRCQNARGGRACELSIPGLTYSCSTFNPCSGTGICQDVNGVATCVCDPGWRGANTDTPMLRVYANSFATSTCTYPLTDSFVIQYMQDHQCLFWTSTSLAQADGYLTHSTLTSNPQTWIRPIWWISSSDAQASALNSVASSTNVANQLKITSRGYPCRDGRVIPSRLTGQLDNVLYGGPGCLACPPCVDGQGVCVSDGSSPTTTNRVCSCKPNFVSAPKIVRYCTSCLNANCATGPNRTVSVTYPPLKYVSGTPVGESPLDAATIYLYYVVTFNNGNPLGIGNGDAWVPTGGLFFSQTTTDWNIYTWLPDYGQGFGTNYIRPVGTADVCQYPGQTFTNLYEASGGFVKAFRVTYPAVDQSSLTCSLQQCPQLSSDSSPCGFPARGTCNPMVNFVNPLPCGISTKNNCSGACTCFDGWMNGPDNSCEIKACPVSASGTDGKLRICGGTFSADANALDNICPPGSTPATCKLNHALFCNENGNPQGGSPTTGSLITPCSNGWILNSMGKCTPAYANNASATDFSLPASVFPGTCSCAPGWVPDSSGSCTLVGCIIAPNGQECNGLTIHAAWGLSTGANVCDRGANGGGATCRCYLARDPYNPSAQTNVSFYGQDCSTPYVQACTDKQTNTYCGGTAQGLQCVNSLCPVTKGGNCGLDSTSAPSCQCNSGFLGTYCTASACYPSSAAITSQRACTKANTNINGLGATGSCAPFCKTQTGETVPCANAFSPAGYACQCGVADYANGYAPCTGGYKSATCAWFRNDDGFCGTNLANCTYFSPSTQSYTLCNNVPGACTPTGDARNFACTNCGLAYSGSRCDIQVGCGGTCNSTGGVCVNVSSSASATATACVCNVFYSGPTCSTLTCDGAYNRTSQTCDCGPNGVYSTAAQGCVKQCAFSFNQECGSLSSLIGSRCNSTSVVAGQTVYTRISSTAKVSCNCQPGTPSAPDPARANDKNADKTVPWIANANGSCEPYCLNGGTWGGSACNCQDVPSGSSPWGGPRCNVLQCYNGGSYNSATGACTCVDNLPGVNFPWSNATACQTSVCAPTGYYYPGNRWCSCNKNSPYQESGDPLNPQCADSCLPGGVANPATQTCTCDCIHTGTRCEKSLCMGGAEDLANCACACPVGFVWDPTAGLCKQVPCLNGVIDKNTGACKCYSLWSGAACNVDQCAGYHGVAVGSGSNWTCRCDPGFGKPVTGVDAKCTVPLCGISSVGIAQNCSNCGLLNYACVCAAGYFESQGTCLPIDCGQGRAVGGSCVCSPGWNATTPGGTCNINTCALLPQRFYNLTTLSCQCAKPWLLSDSCATYDCGTGGKSLTPSLLTPGTSFAPAFYSCRCATGYRLDFSSGVCLANCDYTGTVPGQVFDNACGCLTGFTGKLCNVPPAATITPSVQQTDNTAVTQTTGFIVGLTLGGSALVGAVILIYFCSLKRVKKKAFSGSKFVAL